MPDSLVRRAAVLGAGTMGSQIAALLASRGIACDLLDLPAEPDRDRLAQEAKLRLTGMRPPPLEDPAALDLITPGNLADDLPRLGDADWVIEAVSEDLETKRRIWASAAPHLRPGSIASSNTSGITISSIAKALPQGLRPRFLGAHFFNPPGHMRLLEVIPSDETDREVVTELSRFAEDVLGKRVVIARDVPNFISNRVGVYSLMVALRAMEELGLKPDQVDSITGPAMGRPRSATFRTLDLVGLDVLVRVCENNRIVAENASDREIFSVPSYLQRLVERGWTGEKAGQGFYKRLKEDGKSRVLAVDIETFQYRDRTAYSAKSLDAALEVEEPEDRLRTLVGGADQAGRFAWRVLSQTMAYAARMVGVASDDTASIDAVMRWGFAWEVGPFQAWDALGVSDTVTRMKSDGLALPPWVEKQAVEGRRFDPC